MCLSQRGLQYLLFQVIQGEVHILEAHNSHGQPLVYYIGLIEQRTHYRYGMHFLPHDARAKTLASGGKSIIEQLGEALSLSMMRIVPNLSVQDGIQAVRRMLTRTWFDAEKCEGLMEALRAYEREYDDTNKVFRDRPLHNWASDWADAFRMCAIAEHEEIAPEEKSTTLKALTTGQTNVTLNDMWDDLKRKPIQRSRI